MRRTSMIRNLGIVALAAGTAVTLTACVSRTYVTEPAREQPPVVVAPAQPAPTVVSPAPPPAVRY